MANLESNNFSSETLALHAAYNYDSQRTLSVPIYQSTAYSFETIAQAAVQLFVGKCKVCLTVILDCFPSGFGDRRSGQGSDLGAKHCETRVPAPSAIRANARTADSPRGVMTGNAAFDRRFCVTAEREQDAPALLTPQFAAWLAAFEQSVEGTLSCFCWENRVFTLALETDYGFAAVADDVDMRDLDAVRRSYENSLREMEETITLLLKNAALFAPRD